MKILIKAFLLSAIFFSLSLNASTYSIDKAHSSVTFKVKHLLITNVKGEFKDFNAEIDFDAKSKSFKTLRAVVKTKSIDTGIEKRDNHLRSEDFFLSSKYPEMMFELLSYKAMGEDGEVSANLTIRGVTKKVMFEIQELATAKDFKGNNRVGFTLKGKIDRTVFGLKWNKAVEFGGVAVSNTVKIIVDIEAVEK